MKCLIAWFSALSAVLFAGETTPSEGTADNVAFDRYVTDECSRRRQRQQRRQVVPYASTKKNLTVDARVDSSVQGSVASRGLLQSLPGSEEESLPGSAQETVRLHFDVRLLDFDCLLGETEVRAFLDVASRTWVIPDDALEEYDHDVQVFVDCAEEGDTILLDVLEPIQSPRRIVLSRPVTIGTFGVAVSTRREGVSPEKRGKTVFTCPRNEGVFLIRAQNVVLRNMAFEGCQLAGGPDRLAIVEVEKCDGEVRGALRLEHVFFRENRMNGPALHVQAPSCSRLEMRNVEFRDNTCAGTCGAVLSLDNRLEEITIIGNVHKGSPVQEKVILLAPVDSRTVASGVKAAKNENTIILVNGGELELTNSSFSKNVESGLQGILTHSACVHLIESSGVIQNCTFTENRGSLGSAISASGSSLTLQDCVVAKNRAEDGGALYITDQSTVSIQDTLFSRNSASEEGGALYIEGSELRGTDVEFLRNSAGVNGGGFYCDAHCSIRMTNASFADNKAMFGGGFEFELNSVGVFRDSTFSRNNASTCGGVGYVEDAKITFHNSQFVRNEGFAGAAICSLETRLKIHDSSFLENKATTSGGAIVARHGSIVTLQNVTMTANTANSSGGAILCEESGIRASKMLLQNNRGSANGGAVIVRRDGDVEFMNSTFIANNALFGGALHMLDSSMGRFVNCSFRINAGGVAGGVSYVRRSNFSADDCTFSNNQAGTGAAVYSGGSDIAMSRSTCRQGVSQFTGGCLAATDESRVTLEDGIFLNNQAENGSAIHLSAASELSAQNLTFLDNRALGTGGGLYCVQTSEVDMRGSSFERNQAENGGVVGLALDASGVFTDCTFLNNSANSNGGVFFLADANLTVLRSQMMQSSAGKGGVFSSSGSLLSIRASECIDGSAKKGACVYARDGSSIQIKNVVISQNRAAEGAGLWLKASEAMLARTTLSFNSASEAGGAVLVSQSHLVIERSDIKDNTARKQGGGVHVTNPSIVEISASTAVSRNTP